VGSETLVNSTTIGGQYSSAVTGLSDGGYVITWMSTDDQDGSGIGVYFQRYDSNGNEVGSETLVNSTTDNDQQYPDVADLNDGGFIITWDSTDHDGSGRGVYAQRYDADGNQVGSETRINTTMDDDHAWPVAEGLSDGGYIIAWDSYVQDGSEWGVFLKQIE